MEATRIGLGHVVGAAVLAVSVAAASPVAFAQFGGHGGLNAGLSSRDLRQLEDILMLDDEQREVVHLLFEDFMQRMQEISRKQRAEREAHIKAMSAGVFDRDGRQGRMIEKANKMRLDLEGQFLGDVRVILSEEQAQQWPILERAIWRNQSVPLGYLSGERVDLTKLIPQVKLEEASLVSISPLLEQYEVDFDRVLAARYEGQTRVGAQIQKVWGSGDDDAINELFIRMRRFSVRVRDVNRRYAREIGGMLAGEEQARFNDAFKRASFPQVFRPGRAQRVLDLVLAYEDLSGEQRSIVEGIGEGFSRDMSNLNEQHIAVAEKLETSMNSREWGRYLAAGDRGNRGGDREQTPLEKVVQKKRELDSRIIERIQRLLSEAQAERLEDQLNEIRQREREQRGDRGRQFRRDR